jgi:pSer/pThr/pTyr-binding forkhead associated (FHA) protein
MNVNLVLLKKNGGHKSFQLANGKSVLGRRHDCDLRIPLISVSRRHCLINLDNGSIKIRDLNSMNGTQVNGEAVEEVEVKAGDAIKIGPLSFILQVDGIPKEFAPASAGEKEVSSEAEPEESLSEILDGEIAEGELSDDEEGESEELDFLLNED